MPNQRHRNPFGNIVDFFEMFFGNPIPKTEGEVTIISTAQSNLSLAEKAMLDHMKEIAIDVEYEEIQG